MLKKEPLSLVLATRNKHKVEEISKILKDFGIDIVSLDNFKDAPEVEEDGETLVDNASKKARTIALYLRKWALADDTGLEVSYLKGEPGVYSARWAGPGCSYEITIINFSLSSTEFLGQNAKQYSGVLSRFRARKAVFVALKAI